MAFVWIWECFLAAIIVQEESATDSQLLGGVEISVQIPIISGHTCKVRWIWKKKN